MRRYHLSCAAEGLRSQDIGSLVELHGENLINVSIPSYFSLLLEEVLHPFYIFQVRYSLYNPVNHTCINSPPTPIPEFLPFPPLFSTCRSCVHS